MAPLLLRHQLMHRSSRLGRCIRLWEFPQFHHWRHPPRRGFHSKPRQADRGNDNRIRLSLCDQNVWENELSASPSPPANFVWAGTTRSDNRLCCRLRVTTTLVAGWSHWSFGKPSSSQPPKNTPSWRLRSEPMANSIGVGPFSAKLRVLRPQYPGATDVDICSGPPAPVAGY